MKNLVLVLVLLLSINLLWAADTPFRQRAISPDKKWLTIVQRLDQYGAKTTDWRLRLANAKTKETETVIYYATQEIDRATDMDDSWGIYDFAWSPDSRYILFVYRPYSSNTISHSNDCFGVIDIVTKQYTWLAGPVVDQMTSDLFGYSRPDFKLKWIDRNTVSFYLPKTEFQGKTKPAGTRVISIAKIRQVFYAREQETRVLAQKIIAGMKSANWQEQLKPLFVDQDHAKYQIDLLAQLRHEWKTAQGIKFMDYYSDGKIFVIVIPVTKLRANPFMVSKGKIIEIPLDLD